MEAQLLERHQGGLGVARDLGEGSASTLYTLHLRPQLTCRRLCPSRPPHSHCSASPLPGSIRWTQPFAAMDQQAAVSPRDGFRSAYDTRSEAMYPHLHHFHFDWVSSSEPEQASEGEACSTSAGKEAEGKSAQRDRGMEVGIERGRHSAAAAAGAAGRSKQTLAAPTMSPTHTQFKSFFRTAPALVEHTATNRLYTGVVATFRWLHVAPADRHCGGTRRGRWLIRR